MPRELTNHRVNECNEKLVIEAMDEPGSGGANHRYDIYGYRSDNNPSADDGGCDIGRSVILFQNGPIKEVGVNGITNEALLAILIDRMEGFQRGPYACEDNAICLAHLEGAMQALHKRTREREARGVEGTHEK